MSITERKSLEEFDGELAQAHMRGQWQFEDLMTRVIGGPKPGGVPYVWPWEMVHSKLVEACEVLPASSTARRSLLFLNPGLERGGTTHTLLMGTQIIRPGELAWAHRHSMAALRFVIKGNQKVFTVVDGEPCPMEDFDLILTPQWTWHDHHNEQPDDHAIWLDVLDVPLLAGLNVPFFEPYPGESQQTLRPNEGEYLRERARALRPTWEQPKLTRLPMRYPWDETEAQLKRMAGLRGSPFDGLSLEYVNPMTGGPTLPTMSCWVQMLRPAETTQSHRHTSSTVYLVLRGEGKTVVGAEELEWGPKDVFCVPNWAWHQHINRSRNEDAVLFSVSDTPVLRALGLYWEEPENSLNVLAPPPVPAVSSSP